MDGALRGPGEGLVTRRGTPTKGHPDPRQPGNFAKIRVNFAPPLVSTDSIGELKPTPKLPDGKRFKVIGKFRMPARPSVCRREKAPPRRPATARITPFRTPARRPIN